MKAINISWNALICTSSCLALHAASCETAIPISNFMTPTQLATWSQQKHEKAMAAQAAAAQSAPGVFYTGKPYLAESGTYAFKYRQYNPEMARWITIDQSGFPDGANNRIYVSNKPNVNFDYSGLFSLSTTAPSPSTAYDPSGTYYAQAYNISSVGAGSGAAGLLESLINQAYPQQYNVTLSKTPLSGTVSVMSYKAVNYNRSGISEGAVSLYAQFQYAPDYFTWIQMASIKGNYAAPWSNFFIDTTGFGAPSYNVDTDPGITDMPTLGQWTYNGLASGGARVLDTFAATISGKNITIYDGFNWGGFVE